MPAKSKSQQRLFGMVHALQKGELKGASSEVKKIAGSISDKDADDLASTKHNGLPEKKKEESYLPTWTEWLQIRRGPDGNARITTDRLRELDGLAKEKNGPVQK